MADFEPISITQRAAEEILNTMRTKNIPADYGLRVGVKGGGCGVAPLIGFDKVKENDETFLISGITVYIDKRHTLFIAGKVVDFYEGGDARGFMFT